MGREGIDVAWSTSELATLAGTTVNTIRHYHRLGLLEEPDRRHNGYKQYEMVDLVRLLHIRRLVELGVPLSRIKEPSAGSPRRCSRSTSTTRPPSNGWSRPDRASRPS